MNLIPYSFHIQTLPQPSERPLPGSQAQGVYITLATSNYEFILDKITGWFSDRDEVELIDHGISDKVQLGYIMLEWSEYEIDPLFLAILRDEETVADYTVYTRDI
jgi:hypothetical protein